MDHYNIQLNSEQQKTLDLMLNTTDNLFIQGKAGTGKTLLINRYFELCQQELVCLAPTGFAAQNLPGGSTLHRFFQFPMGVFTEDTMRLPDPRQRSMLQTVEIVLIDEASMLRSDYLFGIDLLLRTAKGSDVPFGGTRMILIGDIFQLPPVVDDPALDFYLDLTHGGRYFFQTEAYSKGNFQHAILNQVHRQNDMFFLEILDAIRFNSSDLQRALDFINNNLVCEKSVLEDFHICCTRRKAREINAEALSTIGSMEVSFDGLLSGEFPDNDLPTERRLVLKEGARVVLLANKPGGRNSFQYTNGSTGVIIGFDFDKPEVKVLLDSGQFVNVGYARWSNYAYDLEFDDESVGHIIQNEVGFYTQLPLMLGFSTTIHKAQGRTLDRTKIVLGEMGFFESGQIYTALSRVRNLNSVSFDRPIRFQDALASPIILDFYRNLEKTNILK